MDKVFNNVFIDKVVKSFWTELYIVTKLTSITHQTCTFMKFNYDRSKNLFNCCQNKSIQIILN